MWKTLHLSTDAVSSTVAKKITDISTKYGWAPIGTHQEFCCLPMILLDSRVLFVFQIVKEYIFFVLFKC